MGAQRTNGFIGKNLKRNNRVDDLDEDRKNAKIKFRLLFCGFLTVVMKGM
jgi:hypothetical protein